MISVINNNNQPAFQAKLKISGIKLPEADKINKQFEASTQHYKNGVLEVVADVIDRGDGTSFKNASFVSDGYEAGYMATFKEFKKFCKENTPEQIAKSLARIFKAGKFTEKINTQILQVNRNIKSATGMLYKAKNGRPNKVNSSLIENAQGRIKTLQETLTQLSEKRLSTQTQILNNDPVQSHFEIV